VDILDAADSSAASSLRLRRDSHALLHLAAEDIDDVHRDGSV
jgi:hypothetical protein